VALWSLLRSTFKPDYFSFKNFKLLFLILNNQAQVA